MSLAQNIEIDFKNALKEKQALKLSLLRMLKSALKNEEIAKKQAALNDEEVMAVLRRELKKRQDSILAFSSAGRNDLADQEKAEAEIINAYLPALMAEVDIAKIVDSVVASGVNGFGLVMKEVMAQTKGQADGQLVQKLVKAKLAL
ncbi:MAG: GatB/YqeY family protein [Parcubacteria group bacterium GW2011_GWA2_36_10]|nr:MAG: GatB/YqeY family protein [Parcubacteria group bacterium GW2011_GWA2_36_10]